MITQAQKNHVKAIKEIFFLTTNKKNFSSENEKEKFFNTWCGLYLKHHPDLCLVYLINHKIAAYIIATDNSHSWGQEFKQNDNSYFLFEEYFDNFPAHLHINTHPDFQGKGVGSNLIRELEKRLKNKNISGLHLITSPDSQNVNFYKKNGFTKNYLKLNKNSSYFFMGKLLSPNQQ